MTALTTPLERFLRADMFHRDIHPLLAEIRSRTPVAAVDVPATATSPPAQQFYVFSHALVREVMGDPERFSNIAYAPQMRQFAGRTLLEMDPPAHFAHRGPIAPLLRSSMVSGRYRGLVEGVVDAGVRRLGRMREADLLADLTSWIPVRVIAGLIGVPESDEEYFCALATQLIDVEAEWSAVTAARTELSGYFAGLVERGRRGGAPGLLDDLLAVRAPRRLSEEELVAFLLLLIPAGIETTHRAAANLLLALFQRPGLHRAVRADRALLPQALEEVMRWEPAVGGGLRIAARPTTLGGVAIPAGALVYTSFLAANRDPARFSDPDTLDVHRAGLQHVTYGHGPHLCLGMHLARFEVVTLVDRLCDALPGLRLDPERPEPHFHGKIYRTPDALPVLC
ncbi:cytochrome P450 [Streptomyces sp. S.PNR 29]|uniref:cytochrome P450 n=1 Tax=Streptomyces sp. S.PNR 29 TaxID=2973805 RepID=UPI0025AF21FF|nr:cytochrome P450 [Streptomyces sp. S.PNR 29]MDN0195314.1 cytochrome P450 [Streptomyces sp. S.PNR 29]